MVVTEPCQNCKYTDCVVVCPTECFYEDVTQLYINPTDCTDCGACIPECPVEAIFYEGDVPVPWQYFIELNKTRTRELIQLGTAHITEKRPRM